MAKKVTTTTVTTVTEESDDDQDILLNILLDRSGSMGGYEKDVIGHYNSYIKEQAALPGKATVSLVLFDTVYEEVYLGKEIKSVPALNTHTYFVRGGTAYLDALGRLIHSVDGLKNKPKKVVFVVNTDGEENSSHEFTRAQIKELITNRQKQFDWQFVFIGAGIDAFEAVKDLGYASASVLTAAAPQAGGIGQSYNSLRGATTSYRSGETATMDFLAPVGPDVDDEAKKKAAKKK